MHVIRISSNEQLRDLASGWNCLTRSVPFRSWEWLATWWKTFGDSPRQLYVLAVYDQGGVLAGVAPWYAEHTRSHGRVLRFLGSGTVCTDYLSVLSTREHEDDVTASLANWLVAAAARSESRADDDSWDLLELDSVTSSDSAITKLVGQLSDAGCTSHRREGVNCWRIELPATWQEYISQFSKSRRHKIRRLEAVAREKDIALRVAENDDQRAAGLRTLIRLHQARRHTLGEPGCFADEAFSRFFSGVVDGLGANGTMQLAWIEAAGQPIAVDASLTGDSTVFLYQSGIDPEMLKFEPGHLSNLFLIQRAIQESRQVVDFLRGDEPYKASWGAQPVSMQNIRVAANRVTPQIRHGMWLAGYTMKNLVKSLVTSH